MTDRNPRSRFALVAVGAVITALLVIIALLAMLLLGRNNTPIVPGPASPSASATVPSASPGPTVLADDNFTPENIAKSSLLWDLVGNCFDNQGRLYLHKALMFGSDDCGSPVYRTLDGNARLFDQDSWDLEVTMTPIADSGLPGDPTIRFIGLSSTTGGADNTIGIGTCGGKFCLLVPNQKGGDAVNVVLGEGYRIGSTYRLSMRVAPDAAAPNHYMVIYRIANLVRDTEIDLLKGSLSVEQPSGFQTAARYDRVFVLDPLVGGTKYARIALTR